MALSLDLRTRIIEAYDNGEGSIRKLAVRFKVGFATIWRLLKRYHTVGEVKAKSPPGKKSKIDKAGLKLMEKLIAKDESITLRELGAALAKQRNLEVSLMAVHRACRRLQLRYKKNALSG